MVDHIEDEELKLLSMYHQYTEEEKIDYWSKMYNKSYVSIDASTQDNWIQLSKDIDKYLHSTGIERDYYWYHMDKFARSFCDYKRYYEEKCQEQMIYKYAQKVMPFAKIYVIY